MYKCNNSFCFFFFCFPITACPLLLSICHRHDSHQELLPDGRKNWYPCQEPNVPFFCTAKHSQDRRAHEQDREVARLSDLSQGREPLPIPLEMGLAFVRRTAPAFHSVLATPGPLSRQQSNAGSGGGGGAAAAAAADAAEDAASFRTQWERVLPGVPLPRGLRTKPKGIDFTYVAATVDRLVVCGVGHR